MSYLESNENKRVLYLDRIEIKSTSKRRFHIKLRIDDNDVEIQQEEESLSWILAQNFDLLDACMVTVIIKTGYRVFGISFGAEEMQVNVSGQDAMDAFWKSRDSISSTTTFDQQHAMVIFKFRPSPTLKDIRDAVQQLESAMEIYRDPISDSSEQAIDLVFKPGTKLAEINPIIGAAFNMAKGTFEVLQVQKKYDGIALDLTERISRILPFAALPLEEVVCHEMALLDGALRSACALFSDAAPFICGYARQGPGVRALKGVSPDVYSKIKELQGDFSKLNEDLYRAVDVESLKLLREIAEYQLIARLKPAEGAGYRAAGACMEGTRTGVLDEVISWALDQDRPPNGSSDGNIYWLYGSPGLGKTSVANSLCERLHRSRNLGASFFCRRDDPILSQPNRVLPTLLCKLAEMWSPYRKLVAQALQDDPQLNPDSLGGEILLKLLQSVQKHPSSPLVMVIDALDECGDPDTRNSLLKSLPEACSHVHWLRIIVTSRPEHDIEMSFKTRLITRRNLDTEDPTRKDIALFTRNSMALVAQRRHLGDWPGEERLKQIVECSGGLFIFVETLRRFLDEIDPEPLLDQLLEEDLKAGLYMLYSTIIKIRIGHNIDSFRLIAQAVVVVAKCRPLCDDTLASLLGLEPTTVRTLIDKLNPLLYCDQDERNGIRVRHLSVVDFLTGPSCSSEFRVDTQQANAELSARCLTTMTKELKFNICDLETSLLANAEIQGLDKRVDAKIQDALRYSCMHWSDHLCSDSQPINAQVSALLDGFLMGPRPLYWIEVLSLMGKVPIAISAMQQIKACIERFQERHREPVDDLLRYLQAFFTPISTSTPHIYISTLPFAPSESWLWKNASKSFPMIIIVSKGRIRSWPTLPDVWEGHASAFHSIACSPDGRHVASGCGDSTIQLWDTETGEAVDRPWRGHMDYIHSLTYSPDGRHVVSGSNDNTVRIWDAETGSTVAEPLVGHTDHVNSVAYSPDGRRIISSSDDNTVRIWDAKTGELIGEPWTGHTDHHIHSVTYSPDGRRVASGSTDSTIRIWDVETRECIGEPLKGHTDWIRSVAYSPDGRHIVSGSDDSTIRIWDARTGDAVGEPLKGCNGIVLSVAYSPDGRHIVSGSYDGILRIWDAETGKAEGEPLMGHTGYVHSVAYSPDGRRIFSGSNDNTIRIWNADTETKDDGHGVMTDSSLSTEILDVGHPVSAHLPSLDALSCVVPRDMLESDGYVRGAEGLLFWVPKDCREGLTCPAIMTIRNTGGRRCVRLELTNFQYGISWTNVYGE